MSQQQIFKQIFEQLKHILTPYESQLVILHNDDNKYYLNTSFIMKNKKPLFFAAVEINKNYVSFHLMPIYVEPALLEKISPELNKRRQGKSCFNFKKIDTELFNQLTELTEIGFHYYQQNQLLAN